MEGKYIGMIGGSIFCGFFLNYLTSSTELLLNRFTPKTLLLLDQCLNLLYPAGCILSYHFPLDKSWLVALNIALRVYNGFLGYPRCLLLIDLTKSQFGKDFDSINSLLNMGIYAGHGLGAAAGSGLYDSFGYNAPFYFLTAMLLLPITLTAVFIPNCVSHFKTGETERDTPSCAENEDATANLKVTTSEYGSCSDQKKETNDSEQRRLTPCVAIPLY